MTADETEPEAQRAATGRGGNSAARAYQRRSRRENAVAAGRLTRTGSPIAAALGRVPFVATIILLLAAGIVGVLWLNTMSDATGLQATASRIRQAAIKTDIEAIQKDVNTLRDPARLAAEARRLGLVPVGDSALLVVGADGKGTVIGTPTPVPGPVPAAPAPATTAPAAPIPQSSAAVTTPVTTPPVTTPPITTTPVTSASATTTPAVAKPAVTTPAATTPAVAKPAVTTPAATTPAKSTAARTAPAQRTITTTTGAGR